ncbi:vitamin K epoxide reductase family protein [Hymenobacter busanensis]|uniref:Vitamin K epoxide reductase family protein n=1 Tax=Hymenobacter busanensis TaxID=2607656 RepID=A0A7L4ZSU7_9BACT|nr:vitamin K epoxide reductase family protein [Hymenobacter busanensis]KAA9327481.1 vitamin K epoxide reductase family protein [Hymenobacter busanensis]QHJ06181.1 vitamin K epoxide reductase [Hymenobacter busanensis]
MNPHTLSHELRNAQTPDLKRRRWIIGLSLLGVALGQIVTLYQTGIIKHLPDPPLDVFDSDKVDASDYAYKRLDLPDAAGMVITYGLTTALASAGGKGRALNQPWLPLLMGAKIAGDVLTNLTLAREEWQENKALCFYCQTASVVSLASLVLAMPEVARAVRNLQVGTGPNSVAQV